MSILESHVIEEGRIQNHEIARSCTDLSHKKNKGNPRLQNGWQKSSAEKQQSTTYCAGRKDDRPAAARWIRQVGVTTFPNEGGEKLSCTPPRRTDIEGERDFLSAGSPVTWLPTVSSTSVARHQELHHTSDMAAGAQRLGSSGAALPVAYVLTWNSHGMWMVLQVTA